MSTALRTQLRMVGVPPAPVLARLSDRVADLTAAEARRRPVRRYRRDIWYYRRNGGWWLP